MTDEGDVGLVIERLTPEASFERLAHEVRLATLRTLDEEGPLSHADLRAAVGVDDPGRFNYHLQKLDGQFVRETEEGYDLAPAGRRVVGAILSGGFTSDLAGEVVPADADCLRCGGPLSVHLEDDGVYVDCADCGQRFNDVDIPPGVLAAWDRAELHGVVDRWAKRHLSSVRYGFCPRCDGRVDLRIVLPDDDDDWTDERQEWAQDLPLDALFCHACDRCGTRRHGMVAALAALEPAVAGFHHEHGIDVRTTPLSDLDWLEMGVTDVVSTDPLRVAVPVELDGDRLVVTFDREFDLVDERRD